jgi:hypothetical protein
MSAWLRSLIVYLLFSLVSGEFSQSHDMNLFLGDCSRDMSRCVHVWEDFKRLTKASCPDLVAQKCFDVPRQSPREKEC